MTHRKPTLQNIILALQEYWGAYGCVLSQPYDEEVGAGTFHPHTFFGVLGGAPWKVAYVQPSRRPSDGRYGDNPNRLYQHHPFQVIVKPSPPDAQKVYLDSLKAIGIDTRPDLVDLHHARRDTALDHVSVERLQDAMRTLIARRTPEVPEIR